MNLIQLNLTQSDETIIEQNEKWFKYYLYLPIIAAILVGLCAFIWSFLDAFEFWLLDTDTEFGTLLIWWAIGAIIATLTYIITKLSLSYKVLHIYYLKEIKQQLAKEKFEQK